MRNPFLMIALGSTCAAVIMTPVWVSGAMGHSYPIYLIPSVIFWGLFLIWKFKR